MPWDFVRYLNIVNTLFVTNSIDIIALFSLNYTPYIEPMESLYYKKDAHILTVPEGTDCMSLHRLLQGVAAGFGRGEGLAWGQANVSSKLP